MCSMNIYSLRLNTFISNDLHCRTVTKWEILKGCAIIEKMQLVLLGELLNFILFVWKYILLYLIQSCCCF